jgi:hypothetical protein
VTIRATMPGNERTKSLKSVASLGADQQMQVRADICKIVDFDSRTLRGSFQRIVHAPLVTQE